MASVGSLIGRESDVERLSSGLSSGKSVLLLGDAGVGKTRVASEVTARIEGAGRVVARAACLPLSTPLPLLPVVDLLRGVHARDGGSLMSAVLESSPDFVRDELAQAVPELRPASTPPHPMEGWRQERLFAALTEFWESLATRSGLVLIIDDLHWSDRASRDFLTYLLRRDHQPLSVLLVARSHEPDVAGDTVAWLRQISADRWVTRHQLDPLSRESIAQLAASASSQRPPESIIDELYRRSEGNAFFAEQLLAADQQSTTAAIPEELGDLLRARAADVPAMGRRVLDVLAVAVRPLSEPELAKLVAGDSSETRAAVRDLLDRQLARRDRGATFGVKHALLGEAVSDALLPAERSELQGVVADVLAERADPSLASEVADHLAAAGRLAEELPARVRAGEYAEAVYAFAAAAQQWQRAFGLAEDGLRSPKPAGMIALRGLKCSEACGDLQGGAELARRGLEAARREGDQHTAAALFTLMAIIDGSEDRSRGRAELQAAVDSFDGLPPSPEQVEALHMLYRSYYWAGGIHDVLPVLHRAIAVGENAPAAAAELARALCSLAWEEMHEGRADAGLATLARARRLLEEHPDLETRAFLGVGETDILLKLNRLDDAVARGSAELEALRTQGFGAMHYTQVIVYNVVEALLGLGRVAEAGALVDPLTDRGFDPAAWTLQDARCRVDIARGRLHDAAIRLESRMAIVRDDSLEVRSDLCRSRSQLALWGGGPEVALSVVEAGLARLRDSKDDYLAGALLVDGMRACADLVERAAATKDMAGLATAQQSADGLRAMAERMPVDPFGHGYVQLEGVDWLAENARCDGEHACTAWKASAASWDDAGRPHRAAYARWREAQVLLQQGERKAATEALRRAWQQGVEHVPLRNAVENLAKLARISLEPPMGTPQDQATTRDDRQLPYDLTSREVDVLRLLTQGLSNSQIGARLYMSPKTASVHVSAILRKLGANNRVHAAAMAQQIGLGRDANVGP